MFVSVPISPKTADEVDQVWRVGWDTPKDPGQWESELSNIWKTAQVPSHGSTGGNTVLLDQPYWQPKSLWQYCHRTPFRGVELILDELLQVGANSVFGLDEEGCGAPLHEAVQRGLKSRVTAQTLKVRPSCVRLSLQAPFWGPVRGCFRRGLDETGSQNAACPHRQLMADCRCSRAAASEEPTGIVGPVLTCHRHRDVVRHWVRGSGGPSRMPLRYAVVCWVCTRRRLT